MIEAKALAIASLFADRMSTPELQHACIAHFQNIMQADEEAKSLETIGGRPAHTRACARARRARLDLERFLERVGMRRLRAVGTGYGTACPACRSPGAFLIDPRGLAQCQECGHEAGAVQFVVSTAQRNALHNGNPEIEETRKAA